MRLLADPNIARATVPALRSDGHDVVWAGDRDRDPGDTALLAEAHADQRVFLTKDHDLGALVFRDRAAHAGVLLIDELYQPDAEAALVGDVLRLQGEKVEASAFLRGSLTGVREGRDPT